MNKEELAYRKRIRQMNLEWKKDNPGYHTLLVTAAFVSLTILTLSFIIMAFNPMPQHLNMKLNCGSVYISQISSGIAIHNCSIQVNGTIWISQAQQNNMIAIHNLPTPLGIN